MELNFEGVQYKIGKMDAYSQLHVARKLGPALPFIDTLVSKRNEGKDFTLLIVLILSKLSDEDSDYVINKCLDAVERQHQDRWAKLRSGGTIMFMDTSMMAMIHLTANTIVENLGDFFRTALASLEKEEAPKG